MDFYRIALREPKKKGEAEELYPDFKIGRSKDLMVQGRQFYAIWNEELGLWSRDEYDVQHLVDADLAQYAERLTEKTGQTYSVKYLSSSSNGGWYQFKKYIQNLGDNSEPLDQSLTFSNTPVKKSDHVSIRLPYALEPGDHSAWDELVGTLYPVNEREKIEWIIGAIVSGDSKKIQKFGVFYGAPGSGKGTVMDVMKKLFVGYTASFDAKALGSNNNQFATDAFRNNPLVAIQGDSDFSKIEDNALLNSITAHEEINMKEKFKPSYDKNINAFLIAGSNKAVKITDAKSGIIRRLIDIHPSGVQIEENHYHTLISRVDFELGAIAAHCLEVYRSLGRKHYSGYRPLEMMLQTDQFFNFIEYNFDIFKEQDGTTVQQAYALYKEYCDATGIEKPKPQYLFREELRNYFDTFKDRGELNGVPVRFMYAGFNANKFKTPSKTAAAFSLVIEDSVSLLDELLSEQPAQYASEAETPKKRWINVDTTLRGVDTKQLHFVKVPENHIVIDFDLKDEDGQKSLERNLEAASNWPATYAELSKSGSGVHLHYHYDADVEVLAPVYSDGIEVKTLLGDSSLRRRLTKCNNVPVTVLSGGLPLKEKKDKMIEEKHIKSEKGVRDLIMRALSKEFGQTKSSVDFIHKILEDAYSDGVSYDVTDLRSTIIAFAAKSSNQALISMKTVQSMKFKGQDQPEAPLEEDVVADPDNVRDYKTLVFFDVEVYKNLFVICWKFRGGKDVVRMINPTAAEVEELFRMRLVGFNCRRYDNHIMWARMLGYNNLSLYNLSQAIIGGNRNAMFGEAYGASYADIYDFSSVKKSLKMFMIDLGISKVEMDHPWDVEVPDKLVDTIVEYCVNDVEGTEVVFEDRFQDYVARQILAELSGLQVNDTTAKHTAQIIFQGDRNASSKFVYTDLATMFPGYTFDLGKSQYRGEDPSEGGYVYAEPGVYDNVGEWDIASMHPTSIEKLNFFGPYTKNYSDLKNARLAIKRGQYDKARKMLDGKLAPFLKEERDAESLSYALKIVINIVYGLTSAKFENPFYLKRNRDNIVAKRGALFMINLKHFMQEQGYKVVHIKTDSIKIAGVDASTQPMIDQIITQYGKDYGYDFEFEGVYDKFCLVNDAVFVARKGDKWSATGAQFQHPFVFKTLFTGEELTFDDLCETKQVNAGTMYFDRELDNPHPVVESMHFIGRTGRFVPVNEDEADAGALYRVNEDKKTGEPKAYAVTGTKGYLWLEADRARLRKDEGTEVNIDFGYFNDLVQAAQVTINKFGDFEEFVR